MPIAADGHDLVDGADFSERITVGRDQVHVGALSQTAIATAEATRVSGDSCHRV